MEVLIAGQAGVALATGHAAQGHPFAGRQGVIGRVDTLLEPGDRLRRAGHPPFHVTARHHFSKQGDVAVTQGAGLAVLPEIAVAKVREDAPFEKICYIGCGVTTGIGAVAFTMKVEPGATVAVFGLGGIGLNVIQGAKLVGARRIIGVDLNPGKVPLATQFGMTDFVNPSEVDNVVDHLIQMTDGGVDYSFEAIGLPATAAQAFKMLRMGGMATVTGMLPVGSKLELDGADLLWERKIQGCMMGSNRFRIDMPRFVEFYLNGKLHLDDMISRHIKLADVNDAFEAMKTGEEARQVIMFD